MSYTEFLQGILPEGTRYSLRIINKATGLAFNRFYAEISAAEQDIQKFLDQKLDVYYATAGFGANDKADGANAVAKRELYVDIDCGEEKPYKDKTEGVKALKSFCKTVGLPQPTLVDSGNGLHAHWVFVQPIAVHEWKGVAEKFKALCKEHDFHVDDGCTADVVRVLRVPGTINHKNNSDVVLLNDILYYEFEALRGIIGQIVIPEEDLFAKAKKLSKTAKSGGLTQSLSYGDPNRVSNFQTIWIRSEKGTGCAQIQNAIRNADTLPEPVWRGVLSIAQFCEDRDWAVHAISNNHPNYSPEETEQKAAGTKGPYTCETFQGLDTAPLCAGCPHLGKITSPILIGSKLKLIPPEEKVVTEFAGRKFEIPSYPAPYLRGSNGGVYMRKLKNGPDEGTRAKSLNWSTRTTSMCTSVCVRQRWVTWSG